MLRTIAPAARPASGSARIFVAWPGAEARFRHVWPVQLDVTVRGIKLIFEGHSLISLCRVAGAPYKYLYGGAPYKSPKIEPPAAAAVVWRARARRTHIAKNR